MKQKEKKKLTIDEYIDIGKSDITVYLIVAIILLSISLYIGIKYNFYYHLIFIGILIIFKVGERMDTYFTLKKIKTYLTKNDILDKIGNIDYWNEKNYFLTDNYMIIKQNQSIYSFQYSEIKKYTKKTILS